MLYLPAKERLIVQRSFETVIIYGQPVRVKIAQYHDEQRYTPEYEDCRKAAIATGKPLHDVIMAAQMTYSSK